MVVVADSRAQIAYKPALRSLDCYARKHNYTFFLLEPHQSSKCDVFLGDVMFWRHCAVLEILGGFDWVVALDGDVGVFNADKRLEDLVTAGQHVILEERFHNGEIQAGGYMIKNSEFGRAYLRNWIGYFHKMPRVGFHNRDNGALHMHLLSYYADPQQAEECLSLWNRSHKLDTYDVYVGCCIKYISSSFHDKIRIVRRGHGFLRDLWVTDNSVSAGTDFFLHALKDNVLFYDPSTDDGCGTPQYAPKIHSNIRILNETEMRKVMYDADVRESAKRPASYIQDVYIRDCWPRCQEYRMKWG